ncbi:tetratricopeptide repeat protein [Mariprofundus erugo]|uniref:tetratricopeptide repeat protein n=1 Tax=Mariprofundus erugo TaxID=2528639 RepID=UPI001386F504|nr:tetratricopeptide repeat protein [Mariprofundus erugo]
MILAMQPMAIATAAKLTPQQEYQQALAAQDAGQPEKAMRWVRKAASHGDADAQLFLCESYLAGDGADQNGNKAVGMCRRAADQGHPEALYQLAIIYESGAAGIKADANEAERLYRQAFRKTMQLAEEKDARARFMLANMYDLGRGTEASLSQAVHWYLLGVALSDMASIDRFLSEIINRVGIDDIFRHELTSLSQNSDADSLYIVGVLHANGWGAEKSLQRATGYYLRAAEAGSPVAAYTVGILYSAGKGLPMDEAKANAWYIKAARAGYEPAAALLKIKQIEY